MTEVQDSFPVAMNMAGHIGGEHVVLCDMKSGKSKAYTERVVRVGRRTHRDSQAVRLTMEGPMTVGGETHHLALVYNTGTRCYSLYVKAMSRMSGPRLACLIEVKPG